MPNTAAHSGTASADTPRRHQRAPRQPAISTPAATPESPIQIHSEYGAGLVSSLSPCEAMYQYAATASATPTSAAHGSHTRRQRRFRQPIAAISRMPATTCTVIGSQPCMSEMWWRNGSGNVTATIVDAIPWVCL